MPENGVKYRELSRLGRIMLRFVEYVGYIDVSNMTKKCGKTQKNVTKRRKMSKVDR